MNSGSFFFREISRMMSSFSPGGAASASTSVTKPYLYSCLTNPSIVSVAVLIQIDLAPRLAGTMGTSAVDGNIVAADLKAFGQPQAGSTLLSGKINVENVAAFIAMKVAMLAHIRAIAHRGPVQ